MHHERIADNIYVFQSSLYAQVTAGVITGPDGAVLIDTLALPEETRELSAFIERDLRVPVRYIINTHYHADHSWGNSFFPGATVIAHQACYEMLGTRGVAALEAEKNENPQLRNVEIILPSITFEKGELNIQVGKKTLTIFPLPGHSADSIAVLVEECGKSRVLIAGLAEQLHHRNLIALYRQEYGKVPEGSEMYFEGR